MGDTSLFGRWLKQVRQEQGLTQDDLAERVGCATQTIHKIEGGNRRPSFQMAERLALVLQLTPDQRANWMRAARASDEPHMAAPAQSEPTPIALPVHHASFVGRETERSALRDRLRAGNQRLTTLVGPGGIGKTSLALQIAADLSADPGFSYEAAVVLLSPITVVSDVLLAVAEALRETLQGARSAWEQVLAALRKRAVLLVLDNCEHLLSADDGTAFTTLIRRMIEAAPDLQVLATSRERLRLRDEQVIELGGLALPPVDSGPQVDRADAVRLFVERAQRVSPGFVLGANNRWAVAQICRQLEGLPVAIELAAAWTRVLPSHEIATEIDRSLDFLAASERDVPERHRSLRAAIEHSWQLLNTHERSSIARLSVFRGGFDRSAAGEVADADLAVLAALVDKSLIHRSEASGTVRFSLHELVRQYAEERLRADSATHQATITRHARYYAALIQRSIAAHIAGSSPDAWSNLTRNIDNIRVAWVWATNNGDSTTILAMARSLMILYDIPGWVAEGATLFERASAALRAAGVQPNAALGMTLACQGYFLQLMRPAAGTPLLEEGVALLEAAGDTVAYTPFLLNLGMIDIAAARFAEARQRYAQANRLATAHGDQHTHLWTQFFDGVIDLSIGDLPSAEQNLIACLNIWRSRGFNRGIAWSLNWLSDVARQNGRLSEAATFARGGLQISGTTHDRPSIARSLRELGALAFDRGDHDEANYLLTESCITFRTMGSPWVYGRSLAILVQLEVQQHRYAEARAGCAELLQLIHNGASIMLPEVAYGLSLLQAAQGNPQQALALLIAIANMPAEYATHVLITKLRAHLEQQLDATQQAQAHTLANTQQLIPWLEELGVRTHVSG